VAKYEHLIKDIEKVNANEELQETLLGIHTELRERINTGRKIYSELKEEFRSWLVKRV